MPTGVPTAQTVPARYWEYDAPCNPQFSGKVAHFPNYGGGTCGSDPSMARDSHDTSFRRHLFPVRLTQCGHRRIVLGEVTEVAQRLPPSESS